MSLFHKGLGRTNGPTDQRTDRLTTRRIELLGAAKKVTYGQHSALLYVCDIRPKTVNRVKNGQKQSKMDRMVINGIKWSISVNNGHQWSTAVNTVKNGRKQFKTLFFKWSKTD